MKERAKSAPQSSQQEMVIPGIRQFLELMMAPTYVLRLIGFILLSIGMTPKQVAELLPVTDRTCRNWRRDLRAVVQPSDVGKLLVRPLVNIGTLASDVAGAIFAEIDSANFHTLRQIADMIQDRFHLTLSVPTVSRMLHRAGYAKRKAGSLPAKADPAAQRAFYNGTLCPLLETAKAGKAAVFFMDASHFVLGCDFLGSVWCRIRRFVKTFSGRKRCNVPGALEYGTASMLTITNDSYIASTQVCDMLRKIAVCRDERALPSVSVVLDNAQYQRCRIVQELASELNAALVFLPTYSPYLEFLIISTFRVRWRGIRSNRVKRSRFILGPIVASVHRAREELQDLFSIFSLLRSSPIPMWPRLSSHPGW